MSSESETYVSELVENFSPISRHKELGLGNLWVSSNESESEGSEYNSSLADLGTPMIHEKIKSALSNITLNWEYFAQFWAPVTTSGRRLLSTSAKPFAVRPLSNKLAKYRLNSGKYKYDIDVYKLVIEPGHMILSGGPATAFLNCRNAGLDVFYLQHLIPYKTISGLEVTKDEIEYSLKVVCESHNLALAQVWIPCKDKNNVPFPYSLEDSQTKQLLAIKLTGYLYAVAEDEYDDFEPYFRFGDVTPRAIGEELPLVTLQDYTSHYQSNMLTGWDTDLFYPTSALVICLRSDDTGDFNYVFEFIWTQQLNPVFFLEAILLTLKRCLPRFKFASGAELGDELDLILGESSTGDEDDEIGETQKLKIFQEKRSSLIPAAPEKGKSPTVMELIAPSEVTCKTTTNVLPREVTEKQFGKTMKEAAKDLNVCESTLKRALKKIGIREWRGPNFLKRKANDSSIIEIDANEENNGAIHKSSTININQNSLTIKAEFGNDISKLHIPTSQATFVTVEKEIGLKLKLSVGTFKLKYFDEDEEWISLTSDEDMNDCIQSSKKSERTVVRLRVLPLPSP